MDPEKSMAFRLLFHSADPSGKGIVTLSGRDMDGTDVRLKIEDVFHGDDGSSAFAGKTVISPSLFINEGKNIPGNLLKFPF